MGKKLSREAQRLMKKYICEGLSSEKIAKRIGCCPELVYVRRRINPETGQPFNSECEYRDFLVKYQYNPETDKFFRSTAEYQTYIRRKK